MAQLKKVVEPFGEVNVYPAGPGKVKVVATILMEPQREGTQTGIALDGSGSMKKLYGIDTGGGVVSSIFAKPSLRNDVAPVAQQICAYLARRIDADGSTTCIYWATGADGNQVEIIGDLAADQVERHDFKGPRDFGTGTRLLPAVRYFVDRFQDAPWGFYVFITDGELFDLEEVKRFSTQLAREVAAGRRRPVKFVLIGLGPEVNEKQMEELDDLDTGTAIDLWDHKLAAEMRQLQDIFAEVVDQNARVADKGRILDAQGGVLKDYRDIGLPALLTFEAPADCPYFTLEVNGNCIHQTLSDRAQAPLAQMAAVAAKQTAPPAAVPTPPPLPTAAPATAVPTPPPLPTASPLAAAAPAAATNPDDEVADITLNELESAIDLQFAKDVHLEPPDENDK